MLCMTRGQERVSDPLKLEVQVWTAWECARNQTWVPTLQASCSFLGECWGLVQIRSPDLCRRHFAKQAISPVPFPLVLEDVWPVGSLLVLIFYFSSPIYSWFWWTSCCDIWKLHSNFLQISWQEIYTEYTAVSQTCTGFILMHSDNKHIYISHMWKEVKWLLRLFPGLFTKKRS